MTKITYNACEYDAAAAVNLMDDDIREELHFQQDWDGEQDFFDAYVTQHVEKFAVEFVIN